MSKPDIISKYKDKPLGCWKMRGINNIYSDQFLTEDEVAYFLGGILDHDASLYLDGFSFLQEYYGLERVAELLIDKGAEEFKEWGKERVLKWLLKMEWAQ